MRHEGFESWCTDYGLKVTFSIHSRSNLKAEKLEVTYRKVCDHPQLPFQQARGTKVTTCGAHHRHFVLLQADNWMMLWVPWALRLLWPSSACLVSMTAPVLLAFSEHGRAIPTMSFLIDLHQQSLLLDSFVLWGRDHILVVFISRKRCQSFDSLINKTVSCMHECQTFSPFASATEEMMESSTLKEVLQRPWCSCSSGSWFWGACVCVYMYLFYFEIAAPKCCLRVTRTIKSIKAKMMLTCNKWLCIELVIELLHF